MSAANKSRDREINAVSTTIVMGVNRAISIGDGSGLPLNLAQRRLMPSAIATAMWPPSKGGIGNELNKPTKMFRLATISKNVPIFSLTE